MGLYPTAVIVLLAVGFVGLVLCPAPRRGGGYRPRSRHEPLDRHCIKSEPGATLVGALCTICRPDVKPMPPPGPGGVPRKRR